MHARRTLPTLLLLVLCASVRAQTAVQGTEGPERVPRFEPAAAAPGESASCLLGTLRELGWRIELQGDTTRIQGGQPCRRADLAEARSRGDLVASLPRDPSRARTELESLLHHPATRCAFSFRLAAATRAAVDRLVANEDFRFSALQTGWIGFGLGGARRDGWRAIRSFGRGFVPADSPSAAIEGFYEGAVRAECGVGRQIAQYAALRELFGDAGFDAAFAPEEIVLGTFNTLRDSDSVLLGRAAGALRRDGLGEMAASFGRQAFAGRPGFIFHVLGRETLDDVNNQAENFVVYEVSDEAAQALARAGGLEPFNRQARELWEISRTLDLSAARIYERLLYGRDARLRRAISIEKLPALRRMQAILDQPFFRGFQVYVHPKGVKPVAYHFARLLDRNPRTPFRIELANDSLHGEIYRRWVTQQLAQCVREGERWSISTRRRGETQRDAEKSEQLAHRTAPPE